MKIAVCVKQVPDATVHKRIDPATKRLDRSGEAALNPTDLNAVEEALRIKEAQGGEVVLVSLGPEKALDSLRKALAMGADRAVLVSDEAAAGSDLLGTARALAGALERESADLVLFGQAFGRRRRRRALGRGRGEARRPLISQVAALSFEDGAAHGKRQTEHGYDTISAPLPAVVAVSDAINEPRYPSLKGIMGAKTKPQETLSLADVGVERRRDGRGGREDDRSRPRAAAVARRPGEDRGRRLGGAEDPRPRRGAEAPVKSLVFLEHYHGALEKGGLGVLGKAASLGEAAGVVLGEGASGIARAPARSARRRSTSCEAPQLASPLPQPRVDALATLVEKTGADDVLFGASVLAADVASGLAARLDAGLNWDLTDLSVTDGELVGKRPALGDTVVVDVGWNGGPKLGLVRAGSFDPVESGGTAEVEAFETTFSEFSTLAALIGQTAEASSGPSIEDADIIVAGGRGPRLPRGVHAARGARRRARRRRRRDAGGRRRGLVPVLDAGRTDRQVGLAEALHRLRDLRRDPAQGRHAGIRDDRRDQQGPERADLRLLRHRRRRRPAPDRPEAHGARALARLGSDVVARPIDFPPPFGAVDAVAAPTDPRDERIEVGVAIVGAGPGGLACAIRLGQLLEEHPDVRERLGDVPIAVLEKGKQAGSHLLSGAVMNPSPLRELFRGRLKTADFPTYGEVPGEAVYVLTRRSARPHPPAADDAEPRQPHPLRLRAGALPLRAGGGVGRGRPPGDVRDEAARRARPRASACARAIAAADATVSSCRRSSRATTSSPGSPSSPKGTQGYLTGAAVDQFGLQR